MKIFQGIPFYNYFSNSNSQVNIKVFRYYKQIQQTLKTEGIDLILGFVGSEGNLSSELVKPFIDSSSFYFELSQEDKTLSDKFNYCFEVGRDFNPDIYCISGSNDMVTKIFYNMLDINKDLTGVKYSEQGINYIIDSTTRIGFLSKGKYPNGIFSEMDSSKIQLVGGIYALSKRFLELCHWRPFSLPYDEVGMEYAIHTLFKDFNLEILPLVSDELKLYNVKGVRDLNGYELCKQLHYYRDLNEEEINLFFKMWDEL